jgi:hypothetical protein
MMSLERSETTVLLQQEGETKSQTPTQPFPLSSSPGSTQFHIALLSCTHVFHETCIEAFERFTAVQNDESMDTSTTLCTCPVCRSAYTRRRLVDVVLQEEEETRKEDDENQVM